MVQAFPTNLQYICVYVLHACIRATAVIHLHWLATPARGAACKSKGGPLLVWTPPDSLDRHRVCVDGDNKVQLVQLQQTT